MKNPKKKGIKQNISLSLSNNYININNNIFNNKNKNKNIYNYNDYNDFEINNLAYEEALKIDKRSYIQYYFSLLRMKHILVFTFYTSNDYNSRMVKISLFLFDFALSYTINALFFNDSTIHKIYEDKGSFNFIYQIPQILYSTIIFSTLNSLIKYLSLSENNILEIKNENENERIINTNKY